MISLRMAKALANHAPIHSRSRGGGGGGGVAGMRPELIARAQGCQHGMVIINSQAYCPLLARVLTWIRLLHRAAAVCHGFEIFNPMRRSGNPMSSTRADTWHS